MSSHRVVPLAVSFAGWLLLACPSAAAAQQPPAAPPLPQAQPAAPPDTAAQIDQLLKRAWEEMNTQGRNKQAEETAKQALELSQKLGDKSRIVQSMLFLSSAYYYVGRMQESLEMCEQTVALAREAGNRKALARALNNIATVLRDLGRYEDSLNYYHQVVALGRELNDLPGLWTAYRNIGHLYAQMGDTDRAEAPLQESLRIAPQLPANSKIAQEASLLSLGVLEALREHYQAALNYYERSRSTKPENPLFMAELLTNMASAHEKLGESQKSVELLQQALKIQESTGTGINGATLSDLGYSQESLGQLNQALASQERALALVRHFGGNPEWEWQFESRIAHVERALGRNAEALRHYQDSINGLELLRAGALNTEFGRASLLARSRAVYAETADLLYDMHREAQALEIAEHGRARAFLDILAQSKIGLADELTPQQRAREEALLARISAIQKELWKENLPPKEEQRRKTELAAAEDDLEAFHLEVRRANPRYASVGYPEPMSTSRIQNDLLDPQTMLVEFLLGEKRSLVWAVSKDRLAVAVLPPRKEIEEQVLAYRKLLAEKASALTLHQSLPQLEQRGRKLYAMLLQPLESSLASSRRLIVVPDGALGYLPFETLVARTRRSARADAARPEYLLERFAIVYAPSASALAAIHAPRREPPQPPKALLAFGDPIVASPSSSAALPAGDAVRSAAAGPAAALKDEYAERGFAVTRLPYTRAEVLAIARLFPALQRRIYLGEQAREETVKTEKLEDYRFIHFASHGFIDENVPARSGILFSQDPHSTEDGVLQMGEIMRLKMNADLVTLSACGTGLGKLVSGEGILGLTRAFFYAGARNVAVSLWNVNDSATAELMKAFYQNLNRGLPKAEALRKAKLALLSSEQQSWRHPYFWAAFVLVGEGK